MSRTYVVTGSTSGIGKATQQLLEERGHRVVGVGRNGAEITLDLGDPAQRATLAERVTEAVGELLDGVIAVAGTTTPSTVGVHVNYLGARDTVESLRPLLARSTAPRAVIVTSISVVHPDHPELTDALIAGDDAESLRIAEELVANGTGYYIYSSAKRAISEWVRLNAITERWAGAGIALNSVAPGTFVTPMTQPILETEQGRAMVARTVPMPLNGPAQPEVAARLLAWMAGEENSHISGQAIFIDGGAEAALRGPRVFGGLSLADLQ